MRGDELLALLKLKPGEQANESEIRDFAAERSADRKSLPKFIQFVTAYP